MLSLRELCKEANKHILNDPPNAPTLDTQKLRSIIGSKEVERLLACCRGDNGLPTIQFYMGTAFYYMEYKITQSERGEIYTVVLKDDRGEVHSVIETVVINGEAVSSEVKFTKEL